MTMLSLTTSLLSPTHLVSCSSTNYNIPMANTSDPDKLQSSAKRVAVIGAGVSGLAAAYKLKSNGLNVTLLEADERAGGKIRSAVKNGYIWDEGANTMTESESEVTSLLDDLGIRDKQQLPLSQNKRYVVRDGLPVLLPSGPISIFTSNFLSAKSKLRLLCEPFSWRRRDNAKVSDEQADESVSDFFGRHFGEEFVDYLIDPFVGGTSAADPKTISMRHSFPELWDIEDRFGSIIAGAIQSRLTPKPGEQKKPVKKTRVCGSFSFKGGMQTLIDTICERFSEDELKLKCKVLSLSYSHEGHSNNWSLSCLSNKSIEERPFDAVVVTAPLTNVKDMKILKGGSPFSLDFVPEVDYLPVSIIVTAFKKVNVERPLEGFGVLIPSKEQEKGLKTLGTLFSSMMFPDRSPADQYLYTTFIGGSRNRELARATTDELKQVVLSDLQQLLGVKGDPSFINHVYWSKAFPRYGQNYESVKMAIAKMENDLPSFFYAGNHKDGLSVGKALASGYKAADLVMSYLNSYSNTNQTL
ncbi:protoporphyrinogen oxidase 2-like [Silene latifolia]|uniref:protoporphyrinogen oxidase 2-like n=1 Tax=Silene latifolia TaxID=37657 RepID=UPI003D76C043